MKLMFLIACGSMLYLGTTGIQEPETTEALAPATTAPTEATAVTVPEPNMVLFAGIGGLTLLIFAIRRK